MKDLHHKKIQMIQIIQMILMILMILMMMIQRLKICFRKFLVIKIQKIF